MSEIIEIEDDDQINDLSNVKLKCKIKRRIIFCIDVGIEMEQQLKASAHGGIKDTNLYFSSRLESISRCIKRYVATNKLLGNQEDEYAIMILKDHAQWWEDFTTASSNHFESRLENIYTELGQYDALDTRSIFDCIREKVKKEDPFFTQVILIFSRDTIPIISSRKHFIDIRNSKYFTLDVIFMHGMGEHVQQIYDFWNDFDSGVNRGWYYETGGFQGKDTLTKAFSQLLAHPQQRGEQERIEDYV